MLADQIKVGVRVKCIYSCDFTGKTGTISRIRADFGYWVDWDDGSDDRGWSFASSMEMIEGQASEHAQRLKYALTLL